MVETKSGRFYVHANQQYSVMAISNAAGEVVERRQYGPYGEIEVNEEGVPPVELSVGYTGREWDADVGMYYFRARWYSPKMGRFVNRDPAGYVDGKNLYQGYFVPGAMDPSGEKWQMISKDLYQAGDEGDSLQDLSMLVTGSPRDWACIWPVGVWKQNVHQYPRAQCGDKADVSNLTATDGPVLRTRMDQDGYGQGLFDGDLWQDGGMVITQIKIKSGRGATPIKYYSNFGHSGIVPESWGGDALTPDRMLKLSGYPSAHVNFYDLARKKDLRANEPQELTRPSFYCASSDAF